MYEPATKKRAVATARTWEESILLDLWTQKESNAFTNPYVPTPGPSTPVDSTHTALALGFLLMMFGICW